MRPGPGATTFTPTAQTRTRTGRPATPARMLRCHTPPQCGGRAPPRGVARAAPVVRCARGGPPPQASGLETAARAAESKPAERPSPSLAERLRLGSLLEDGLSYKESFIVRCYEVGINKTATVETIANLLQVRSNGSEFRIRPLRCLDSSEGGSDSMFGSEFR